MSVNSLTDLKTRRFWTALVAELLGTFLFVLVACGSTMGGNEEGKPSTTVQISLAFGFSIATIVWVTARVSGGHLNPAVTVGFMVTRKISLIRGVLYVVVQTGGAIIAAAVLKGTKSDSYPTNGKYGASLPAAGIDDGQALGIELLITFILVITVFSAVDSGRTDVGGSAPLTIGLAIAMCHLWAVPLTGAGMNPARSLGPAIIADDLGKQWIYWVGPLIGGALAALIYDFCFAVNATPAKIAGFFTPSYADEKYDQHGRRPGSNETEMGKP